jgi:cyclase
MAHKDYGTFRIEELADGVFAVVGDQDGLCHSNAGIIDLGEETLVLDTLTLPSYGETLAAACRDLTGRGPSWIAFTHCHADHLLGNQAFPSTTPFVATHAMLPLIEEWMAEYQEAIDEPAGFAKEIEQFATTCEAEDDPTRRAVIETNLARYRALYDEIGTLRLVRPNTLFEGTMRLVGSKRAVELIEVSNAHTASDVYLRLPDEGILFMGDLGFFDTIPFLAYADPLHWSETLRAFEDSEIRTYVPGHGVVGTVDRVTRERECIDAIVDAVRTVLAEGGEITETLSERLSEPFRTWSTRGRLNETNYQAVANSLKPAR